MKLIGKTIAIGILILFIGASIPGIAELHEQQIAPLGEDWYDDFESYEVGQYLDNESDPLDGGWHGWDNDPAAGAYVVEDQAHSPTKSLEVVDVEDPVHEFNITEGKWNMTCYQYIPGDTTGSPYFIMLDIYEDGGAKNWALQVAFNTVTDTVESEPEGMTLPIIYDDWVEIKVEIDLEEDYQYVYYGGDLLTEKSWSEGVSGGGITEIQCVDLWGNGASAHYYDDFSLVEVAVGEQPELEIGAISGGLGLSSSVKNVGTADATDVEWSISHDGGLVFPKEKTGTISTLEPDGEEAISSIFFGIGKPTFTVSAECAEGKSAEATASGLVFIIFILGVS